MKSVWTHLYVYCTAYDTCKHVDDRIRQKSHILIIGEMVKKGWIDTWQKNQFSNNNPSRPKCAWSRVNMLKVIETVRFFRFWFQLVLFKCFIIVLVLQSFIRIHVAFFCFTFVCLINAFMTQSWLTKLCGSHTHTVRRVYFIRWWKFSLYELWINDYNWPLKVPPQI